MTRSRTSRASRVFAAGPALAGLALAACLCGCEARYYGRYRSYGGSAVVRTTTVAVRPRGRWGRKLLQADYDYTGDYAQPPLASALEAPAPAPEEEVDDTEERTCQTVLDVLRSRPELSLLTEALEDLPRVRAALDNPTRTDTFFAPTNDAMEKLLAWGDFVEKAEVRLLTKTNLLRPLKPRKAKEKEDASAKNTNVPTVASTFRQLVSKV